MRICGYGISDVSCNPVSLGAKDVAIALVALAALGIIVTGSLQLAGIVSIGALASSGSVFIGIGSCVLVIDVLVAIVKNCSRKLALDEEEEEPLDLDPNELFKEPEVEIPVEEVVEAYNELKAAVQREDLLTSCQNLTSKIEGLNRENRKKNKDLINTILKLQIAIKTKFPDKSSDLYKALKALERAALLYYFHSRLHKQIKQVTLLEKKLGTFPDSAPHFKFLKATLQGWKRKLYMGKLVSFPKWFHCTDTIDKLESIVNSEIRVMHAKVRKGAFVSSKMEIGSTYGYLGIALSKRIQKKATLNFSIDPTLDIDSTAVTFVDKKMRANSLETPYRQMDGYVWIGFQRSIPVKREDKTQEPLLFYADTGVSFLFYENGRSYFDKSKIKKLGKSIKVSVASSDELNALIHLFQSTFTFTLPKESGFYKSYLF